MLLRFTQEFAVEIDIFATNDCIISIGDFPGSGIGLGCSLRPTPCCPCARPAAPFHARKISSRAGDYPGTPPPTQRYFPAGAVIEGVSGELRYDVEGRVGMKGREENCDLMSRVGLGLDEPAPTSSDLRRTVRV